MKTFQLDRLSPLTMHIANKEMRVKQFIIDNSRLRGDLQEMIDKASWLHQGDTSGGSQALFIFIQEAVMAFRPFFTYNLAHDCENECYTEIRCETFDNIRFRFLDEVKNLQKKVEKASEDDWNLLFGLNMLSAIRRFKNRYGGFMSWTFLDCEWEDNKYDSLSNVWYDCGEVH